MHPWECITLKKKVVPREPFILQFIRKVSVFRAESAG